MKRADEQSALFTSRRSVRIQTQTGVETDGVSIFTLSGWASLLSTGPLQPRP
jgi:hypothetical protein